MLKLLATAAIILNASTRKLRVQIQLLFTKVPLHEPGCLPLPPTPTLPAEGSGGQLNPAVAAAGRAAIRTLESGPAPTARGAPSRATGSTLGSSLAAAAAPRSGGRGPVPAAGLAL